MTIVFSMKVRKDSNKVQVLMLCPECREELEMARRLAKLDAALDEIRARGIGRG